MSPAARRRPGGGRRRAAPRWRSSRRGDRGRPGPRGAGTSACRTLRSAVVHASGTRALVLLLEDLGAEVRVTETAPRRVTGPSARDRRPLERRPAVRRGDFVDAGGTAVVADPGAASTAVPGTDGGSIVIDARGRSTPLPRHRSSPPSTAGSGASRRSNTSAASGSRTVCRIDRATDPSCFGDETHAFVVARTIGRRHRGRARRQPHLDERPPAPRRQRGPGGRPARPRRRRRRDVPPRHRAVGGRRPRGRLVATTRSRTSSTRPVWMALAATRPGSFVVLAVRPWHPAGPCRRRTALTPIAGSELVVATGNLMHRARHAERAASLLRYDAPPPSLPTAPDAPRHTALRPRPRTVGARRDGSGGRWWSTR